VVTFPDRGGDTSTPARASPRREIGFLPVEHAAFLLAYFAGIGQSRAKGLAQAAQQQADREASWRRHALREAAEARRATRPLLRFSRLLEEETLWFGPPRTVRSLTGFTAKRSVRPEHAAKLAPFRSSKLGRIVQCESNLERRFYSLLDQMDDVWFYQEQPVRIPVRRNRGKVSFYHPDALIVLTDGRAILAEIKPTLRLVEYPNPVKGAALADYCRRHGYGLFIGNTRKSLKSLVSLPVSPGLVNALALITEHRWLHWPECRQLLEHYHADGEDLAAAVLQHGLALYSEPFRLRRLGGIEARAAHRFVSLLREAARANVQARLRAQRLRDTEQYATGVDLGCLVSDGPE
jgi:hypothetical protein